MAQRKSRCQKTVGHQGKRPIKCGMPLDEKGRCPDHGTSTK